MFTKAGVELNKVANDGTTTTYEYVVKPGDLSGDTVLELKATTGDSYSTVQQVDFTIFICAPPEFAAEPNTLFSPPGGEAVYDTDISAWPLEVNAPNDIDR